MFEFTSECKKKRILSHLAIPVTEFSSFSTSVKNIYPSLEREREGW